MNIITVSFICGSLLFFLLTLSYHADFSIQTINCFIENKKNFYNTQTALAYGVSLLKSNFPTNSLPLNTKFSLDNKFDNKNNKSTFFLLNFNQITNNIIEIIASLYINSSFNRSHKLTIEIEKSNSGYLYKSIDFQII